MPVSDRNPRTWWSWARPALGALIVGALLARVGIEPFLEGLRSVSAWSVLAAVAITLVTTTCAAWRWSLVARELEVDVPVPAAIAACYRSQLLNSTLPGGVLGDVHRAVRHGRDVDAVWLSARSVAWERVLGQGVQLALTAVLVLAVPSPLRPALAPVVVCLVLLVTAGALVARLTPRRATTAPSRVSRVSTAIGHDLRHLLLTRRTGPPVVLASVLVVLGHLTVLLVAGRAVGVSAPTTSVVVVGLVVLLAAAIPTNIAGWGPREGVAAWAFAVVGAGAATGVAVATLYGVLSLIACLPGALLLLIGRRTARRRTACRRATRDSPVDPPLEVAR